MTEDSKTNLTVVVSELEPCRLKVDIEAPADRVRAQYEEVLKTFHGAAQIPGFRPGKSPRKLLERKYRPRIQEETVSRLVNQCTKEALDQENLQPETQPRIEKEDSLKIHDPDQAFVYSVTFDMAPSFELPDYTGFTIQRRQSTVDDEAVETFVTQILEQRASYEAVERPAEEGDLLKVSYHGSVRDAETSELPETARFLLDADETWLPLREPEMLPGATEQLLGCEAGEVVAIDIIFPESFVEDSLAGRVADYTVTIHEIQTQNTPLLTDEIAQSLFGVENAQAVRDSVRPHLEQREEQNRHRGLREDLLEKLMAGMDFPVPPGLVAQESYDLFRSRLQQAYQQNPQQMQQEDFQKQLWAQVSQEAQQRLRRRYVLRRIADQESIEVTGEEVDNALEQMARMYRMSAKVLRRRLRENGRLVDVFLDLREDKTIERLLEQVTVEDPEDAEAE